MSSPTYSFEADERIPPGTIIGRASARGRNLAYRIVTNGADQVFAVQTQTYSNRSLNDKQSFPHMSVDSVTVYFQWYYIQSSNYGSPPVLAGTIA